MRVAIIMAGGSGERFWPLSRKLRPKQLLNLSSPDRSMLQEAVDRVSAFCGLENVYVATTPHLVAAITASNTVASDQVWAEPDKRNTLGCLCWVAANLIAKHGESARQITCAIVTADHRISPLERFVEDLEAACQCAESQSKLVTIGIVPTRPDTGFGYIESGAFVGKCASVSSFREKPDLETAKQFLNSGNFCWNSGMFVWKLDSFLSELELAHPGTQPIVLQMAQAIRNGDLQNAAENFRQLPNQSIDYALMEKSRQVAMIPSTFQWDDLGSFDALLRSFPTDENGNVVFGNVQAIDCENSVLYNECTECVMAAVNIKNMVMVQTADAVLLCPLQDSQRVKEIVAKLSGSPFV